MASSKRWSRLRWGALVFFLLLLGVLGYFGSKAAALSEDELRAGIVARLAAWSGGKVEVSGPFELHYFPDLAITMGSMKIDRTPRLPQIKAVSAKGIRVELGLRSLILPRAILHSITLTDLDVTLRPQPGPAEATAPADPRPLIEALRSVPVPELTVVNGEINREGADGRDGLRGINASAAVSPDGALRASGSVTWREEELAFDLATTLPATDNIASGGPLTLSLEGPMVTADVEGELMLANGLRAAGTLDIQIPDLRRFTRWVGLLTPDGPGLGRFEASGGYRLNAQRLGFDQGTFLLDGNRALGTLTLDFAAPRPLVSGTLAFSAFDIRPYFEKPAPASAAGSGEPSDEANFPLLHHLDLDLRLSTSTVQAPKLTLGQVAMAATVKAGRLTADFAVLDLCSGNGNGRMEFDAAATQASIRLTGNFNRLAAQECLRLALGHAPLSGELDLLVDIASKGRTASEMLRHLQGTVNIESGAGTLALDLAALRARAEPVRMEGWESLAGNSTAYTSLRADLAFREGGIVAETARLQAGPLLYSGRGMADTGSGLIDFSMLATPAPADAAGSAPKDPAPEAAARLTGSWSKPVITVTRPNDAPESEPALPAPEFIAPAPVR